MFVPVVDKDNNPLMPTKPSRARRWIRSGKATPFWKKGIFCVRLNYEPSLHFVQGQAFRKTQDIVVGIDPGSKKEALTVKSEAHTYLNIQADAVTWVKDAVHTRRNMFARLTNDEASYGVEPDVIAKHHVVKIGKIASVVEYHRQLMPVGSGS